MARQVATLDFGGGSAGREIRNVRLHILAADPGSPGEGQMWYNSTSKIIKYYDGTNPISLSTGTTPDATTSSKGIVQLAGDLAGTAASPQIAAGAVTNADVNAAAAIAYSKLNLAASIVNADVASGAAIAYSKLNLGASIVNSDISGTAAIAYSKLNLASSIVNADVSASAAIAYSKIAAPTASADMGSQRVINVADPTGAQDAATKNYVDNSIQGLDAKLSVRRATTGSETFTISSGAVTQIAGTTLDGGSPAVGERILIKDAPASTGAGSANSNQPANGIYTVTNNTTNLSVSRATDMDNWSEVPSSYTWVEQGTANGDTGWLVTADQGGTINTTAIQWSQFGASTQIVGGNGLAKTGNTLDVNVDSSTIEINADILRVKDLGITNAKIAAATIDLTTKVTGALPVANGGTGQTTAKAARETGLGSVGYYSNGGTHSAGTTITIAQTTHGLRATKSLLVQTQDASTGDLRTDEVNVAASGDVTITFAASQSANTILVTIVG